MARDPRGYNSVLLVAAWIVAGALAVLAALAVWQGLRLNSGATGANAHPVARVSLPSKAADLSVIFDTSVKPISEDDAIKINEDRPLDVKSVTPARPFRVAVDDATAPHFAEAVRCLTQAIYYEAASEPEAGQRAVAQVIINRLRHPAFPKTICGVVYQGSERATGCQFTFTCDGSLARVPAVALYARAERIARQALAGHVAASVGNATNYHAVYVVPYWAPTLDKIARIGAHIFYGLRGALGFERAFSAKYDLARELTVPDVALLPAPEDTTALAETFEALPGALPIARGSLLSADERSGQLMPGGTAPAVQEASTLKADHNRGELIVGTARMKGEDELDKTGENPGPAKEP